VGKKKKAEAVTIGREERQHHRTTRRAATRRFKPKGKLSRATQLKEKRKGRGPQWQTEEDGA